MTSLIRRIHPSTLVFGLIALLVAFALIAFNNPM